MKRSRSIELAVMGAVPLLLAACGPPHAEQPTVTYQSLQQCISEAKVPPEVCQKTYDEALLAHERAAPQYGTAAECAAQYGYDQCRRVSTGSGDVFIPALAGFMLGRALGGWPHHHYYYGGYDWAGQPIYRSRGDRAEWRTLEGERFGPGARGPAAPPSVGETLSRGGFGYSSAARASWGG